MKRAAPEPLPVLRVMMPWYTRSTARALGTALRRTGTAAPVPATHALAAVDVCVLPAPLLRAPHTALGPAGALLARVLATPHTRVVVLGGSAGAPDAFTTATECFPRTGATLLFVDPAALAPPALPATLDALDALLAAPKVVVALPACAVPPPSGTPDALLFARILARCRQRIDAFCARAKGAEQLRPLLTAFDDNNDVVATATTALLAGHEAVRQALVVAPEGRVAELQSRGRCATAPVRVLALHSRAFRTWCATASAAPSSSGAPTTASAAPPGSLPYTDAEYIAVVRARLSGRATHFVCVAPKRTAAGTLRELDAVHVLRALALCAPRGGLVLLEPVTTGREVARVAFARPAEAANAVATQAAQLCAELGAVVTLDAPAALPVADNSTDIVVAVHNVTSAAATELLPRLATPPLAATVVSRTPSSVLRPPTGTPSLCETLVVVVRGVRRAAQLFAETHDCPLADTCLRCEILEQPLKTEPV